MDGVTTAMFARGIHGPSLRPVYYYTDGNIVVLKIGRDMELRYDASRDEVAVLTPIYNVADLRTSPTIATINGQEVLIDPVSQVIELMNRVISETIWLDVG